MSDTQPPFLHPWLDSPLSDLDTSMVFLVGVAIFQPSVGPTPHHELLVVKRAETEEAFPNNWEIPGGHVDASDRDVRHTVERETLEETGLIVDQILGEFDELYWNSRRGNKNIQLNYAASIKPDMPIKLNRDEHSDWLWMSEEQIDTLLMTPAMRKVLEDAFAFAKKYICL